MPLGHKGIRPSGQEFRDDKDTAFRFDVSILHIDRTMGNEFLDGSDIGNAIILLGRSWLDD